MKHFLIDATPYAADNLTGVGRILHELTGRLFDIDRENEYHIFGFAPEIWPPARLPANFAYRRIRRWTPLGPLAMEAARRAYVRLRTARVPTDLLYCPLDMTPVRNGRTRVVCTLHDVARLSPQFLSPTPPTIRASARTNLRYRLARQADMIHTVSEFSAEQIAARLRIDRAKIRVISPGAGPLFTPAAPDPAVLARYGAAVGRYFLFVGQMGRQKNEEGLVNAFFTARQDNALAEDIKLFFVGDSSAMRDSMRQSLQSDAGRRRVRVLGRVGDADLLHLYRGAIAMTLPSFYEGFGLPVVEAMACGTPSIVADAGSLPEVSGGAGLVVAAGDQRALAEALARLAGDAELRARLHANAVERAELFTFDRMTRRLHELFCEMTDG